MSVRGSVRRVIELRQRERRAQLKTARRLLLRDGDCREERILGRRRMFLAGIALFTAASLAGGLATGAWWLLAARAVQGVGGALATPAVLALVVGSFPEGRERTRALGVYSAVLMGGASLGLVLGGVITEWASWRWVLFVNVPVGILVLAVTPLFVVESPRPGVNANDQTAAAASLGMAVDSHMSSSPTRPSSCRCRWAATT